MGHWARLVSHALLFGFLSLAIIPAQANSTGRMPSNSPAPAFETRESGDFQRAALQRVAEANISLAANDQPPGTSNNGGTPTLKATHPAATAHLPPFITAPGETDVLMSVMTVFIGAVFVLILVFYFRLHALPEHIAHGAGVVQYQIVAVLALISLFTHEHIYWILGLLLALVRLPDFATPLHGMADSLAKIAEGEQPVPGEEQAAQPIELIPPRQRTTIQAPISERKDLSHA
jgi:hypothetical protein